VLQAAAVRLARRLCALGIRFRLRGAYLAGAAGVFVGAARESVNRQRSYGARRAFWIYSAGGSCCRTMTKLTAWWRGTSRL